jgi:hypothetical protein
VRGTARASLLAALLVALPVTHAHAAGRFGSVSLWEVSGITGGGESYLNQLALLLEPAVKLGTLWPRAPAYLGPLRLALELQLSAELTGNDARYRTAQFANPSFLPGGGEAIPITGAGIAAQAASASQIEGTRRRPLLSDLWLGLSHGSLYRIPWLGVDLGGRLALTLPTSTPSQHAGLHAGLSFGLSFTRSFFSRLELSWSIRHAQYFYRHATADVATLDQELVLVNGRLEPLYVPVRAAELNPRFAFVNVFAAELELTKRLTLSASYTLTNTFTYALGPASVPGVPAAELCSDGAALAAASGGYVVPCGSRAERDSHWFQLHLELELWPALSLSLGVATLQPVRHEGGPVSNPFLQTLPTANYTTLELGLSVDLERTYELARAAARRLRGTRSAEAGR